MKTVEHDVTVSQEQAALEPYLYLPFEPPPGTTRLDVRLEHDPGNIIDLGVLDPSIGPFPSHRGFRGWSGGARDRFFITTDEATPGYIPGEIQPGKWQVVLGLYRVRPEGCRIRVNVEYGDSSGVPGPLSSGGGRPTADEADSSLQTRATAYPSFPVEPGWYPGDLQSHTHHSDARGSLADLVAAARSRGLRFLAVTDHNTTSHHGACREASSEGLFLIPGEEVTTDHGHANVWGARDWVDFRITRDAHVEAVVRRAHELGGLISVNHPKPGGPDWRYPVPEGIDCLEVWQGPWPAGNEVSLERYDGLLNEGRRITLVGGSDRHQPGWPDDDDEILQVGSPTTWLRLEELSVPACLKAIAGGCVFISEGPAGPHLELRVAGVPMGGTFPGGGDSEVLREHGRERGGQERGQEPGQTSEEFLPVELEYRSALPLRLRLVGSSGELYSCLLASTGESGPAETYRTRVDVREAGRFVRAELWNEAAERIVALANPVYLGTRQSAH